MAFAVVLPLGARAQNAPAAPAPLRAAVLSAMLSRSSDTNGIEFPFPASAAACQPTDTCRGKRWYVLAYVRGETVGEALIEETPRADNTVFRVMAFGWGFLPRDVHTLESIGVAPSAAEKLIHRMRQ